jgi:hypothetical protein
MPTDNFDQYTVFRNLSDEAKARVRARAAAQRVKADPDHEAQIAARVATATQAVIDGKTPSPTVVAIADRIEAAQNRSETWVHSFYTGIGRRFLPIHFLSGADDGIRAMTAKAASLPIVKSNARPGDLVAVATSRPEKWILGDTTTPEVVMERIQHDVHCDLDLLAGTEDGSCMDRHYGHHHMLSLLAKCDGIGKDGKPDAMRRDYIEKHFFTVPFSHGDLIVFARICNMCWGAFLYKNNIDTKEIGIIEPKSDGFGSIGPGPIRKKEYIAALIAKQTEDEDEA